MGGRIEFREKLSGILKMAEENGCQITIDEVECYFEEEHLSKEQIELVFDYLLAQKIVVKGYEKTGGSVTSSEENKAAFTEEEQRYLKEYMKDIGGIREADEEEREALFEKVLEAGGDISAGSCGNCKTAVSPGSIFGRSRSGGKCRTDSRCRYDRRFGQGA